MATTFQQGDMVRARATAQGMVQGDVYRVATVKEHVTPFGVFVTYWIGQAPGTGLLAVNNLHLLADRVAP